MLKRVAPPSSEPISVEEAKEYCRVETDTENAMILGLIMAAREYCETFQRRAFITQTWELWLDDWPESGQIMIPLPPLQGIDSVKYYDVDDNELEMAANNYFVDTKNEPGWIALAYGSAWPTITLRPANGVCITFTAGYDAEGSDGAALVPESVRLAIKLLVGHWYENREASGNANLKDIPMGVASLLWGERIL
jgi:uncharacterized phiE125 gp8 family phage protein